MDLKIRKFLDDMQHISAERSEIVSTIRALFCESQSVLEEGFKYGGLTYSLSQELVGGIYSYKDHVSIEFSNGADFSDTMGVLEGSGKRRRHIKIRNKKDIEDKTVAAYIGMATNSS